MAVSGAGREFMMPMKLIPSAGKWLEYLVAILAGNAIYFALYPRLPLPAQHHPFDLDLGTLIDFWFCLMVFGLLELGAFLLKRDKS
jgi:hypothetical protein